MAVASFLSAMQVEKKNALEKILVVETQYEHQKTIQRYRNESKWYIFKMMSLRWGIVMKTARGLRLNHVWKAPGAEEEILSIITKYVSGMLVKSLTVFSGCWNNPYNTILP